MASSSSAPSTLWRRARSSFSMASLRAKPDMAQHVDVAVVSLVDDEIVEAMRTLIPQLSASAEIPSREQLAAIVTSDCTSLLVARDQADRGRIVGALTLAVFRIPTGVRAWIE